MDISNRRSLREALPDAFFNMFKGAAAGAAFLIKLPYNLLAPTSLKGCSSTTSSAQLTACLRDLTHSDYRTVSPYWVLPVYVELIRAVWADDGDRPLLF
jgi:hypothetical protein